MRGWMHQIVVERKKKTMHHYILKVYTRLSFAFSQTTMNKSDHTIVVQSSVL